VERVFRPEAPAKFVNLLVFPDYLRDIGKNFDSTDYLAAAVTKRGRIFQYRNERSILFHDGAPALIQISGPQQYAPLVRSLFASHVEQIAIQYGALLTDKFFSRIARNAFHRLVGENDIAGSIDNHDPILDGAHDRFPVFLEVSM
jgi:hypothetical protein